MGKWTKDEKSATIEDVEFELRQINSLLQAIHRGYFDYREEFAIQNAPLLATYYANTANLVLISIGLIQDVLETVAIVEKNMRDKAINYVL